VDGLHIVAVMKQTSCTFTELAIN